MTESEWLTCADPTPMLEYLNANGLVSDRKQRLFDCACVRRLWHLLTDQNGRKAVEVAEKFADGEASLQELQDAQAVALAAADAKAMLCPPGTPNSYTVLAAAAGTAWEFRSGADPLGHAAQAVAWVGLTHNNRSDRRTAKQRLVGERKSQAALLREIIGHPFVLPTIRPYRDIEFFYTPSSKIARLIYDHGDFDRLPSLADALQKEGLDHPKLLSHCWLPGPHVRGCWAVDMVLGKD
jgi:hypothetical protein